MVEICREKTSFVTPDGLHKFQVISFGLCSVPATFQRGIETVLSEHKWQTCLVYLYDVIVFSVNFELNYEISKQLRLTGLTIKPETCHFGFHKLQFLGPVLLPWLKVATMPIFDAIRPKSVRRFLRLCAYYQRFIAISCESHGH